MTSTRSSGFCSWPHRHLHVVPPSQAPASLLWHLTLQVLPAPHVTSHFAAWSPQTAVQPLGQAMEQKVLPWQVTVEPGPTVVLASALPLNETLLSAPASMMQDDPPLHVAVQSAAQLVAHVDCDAQVVVQFVPQVVLHELV